jgi:hypothetical protein
MLMASSMHDRGLSGEHQFYLPHPRATTMISWAVPTYLVLPFHYPFYESHSQECHAMQDTMLACVWNCMDEPFRLAPSQPTTKNYMGGGREAPQFHKD